MYKLVMASLARGSKRVLRNLLRASVVAPLATKLRTKKTRLISKGKDFLPSARPDGRLISLDRRIDEIDKDLKVKYRYLDSDVSGISSDLSELRRAIEMIESEVVALAKSLDQLDYLHKHHVEHVSQKQANNLQRDEALSARIKSVRANCDQRIEALSQRAESSETGNSRLQSHIASRFEVVESRLDECLSDDSLNVFTGVRDFSLFQKVVFKRFDSISQRIDSMQEALAKKGRYG